MFNQGHINTSPVTIRDDGELVHVYIDPVNGDDDHEGLSEAGALKSVAGFMKKFPLRMYNDSSCVVNFVNNTDSVVIVKTDGLHLGGGGGLLRNGIVYRGPEMILSAPSTGPTSAALDGTPAVRVDETGASSGTGNSTRLDFTGASPGWTTNNLRKKFVRITRGDDRVFDELPISSNTSDTITVDCLDIVGNLLATDIVELVEPAIHVQGIDSDFANMSLWRDAGGMATAKNFIADEVGPTFTRLSFDDIQCNGVSGVQFDRCRLNINGSGGSAFHTGSVVFKNTISDWHLVLTCANGAAIAGRSDDQPLHADAQVALVQFRGRLLFGGASANGWYSGPCFFRFSETLAVYADGISVQGPGSLLVTFGAVVGDNPGYAGIECSFGGQAVIQGGTLSTITGSVGDLKVGNGAAISYGTGAGEFEEVAGWNGNFTRMLEGTATAPTGDTSRITTDVPQFS
jgi:hypothetical protein